MDNSVFIKRHIASKIKLSLVPNKVVLIVGPRRVGKTMLIQHILDGIKEPYIHLNGEDEDVKKLLEKRSQNNYEKVMGNKRFLIIDEAQDIPDIGMKLKLIVDTLKGIKILVSGSSVFDLNNKTGEPLVGRKKTFNLFPFAQMELENYESYVETQANLESRLIYGSYPELEQMYSYDDKKDYLKEQVESYLLKDILIFEDIKKRDKLVQLLQKLAFRVGSQISIEGLGNELQISKNTVDRYLDLLSKVFVIYKLTGFSRNLDNEITKMNKWYFYDNGIRNALISNFKPLNARDDIGQLWENYIVSERYKYQTYNQLHTQNYFWRTHTQQEIDWVEELNGEISGYECKWNHKRTSKRPPLWSKAYPDAGYKTVTTENYLDFIM